MSILRRFVSLFLSIILIMSMGINTLAVSYDACDFDSLQTAFADTSGEDVSVNVTADIDFRQENGYTVNPLTTQEGIHYTIGSENNSTLISPSFDGAGSVEINMDLTENQTSGLTANGDVEVTVNGDIGFGESSQNGYSIGVAAGGNSQVTVNGSVIGQDSNSDLDYDDPTDFSWANDGVTALDNATVHVTGDVTAGNGFGSGGYGGHGINAMDSSTVIVDGNVSGGDVIGNPDTPAPEYCLGFAGDAVFANSSATVVIGGDVTGGSINVQNGTSGTGIHIDFYGQEEGGSITVGGNVSAGTATGPQGYTDSDIYYMKGSDPLPEDSIPTVTVGSYETADFEEYRDSYFTEEEKDLVLEKLTTTYVEPEPEVVVHKPSPVEHQWRAAETQILDAEEGSSVTVDFTNVETIPAFVISAARSRNVILVIRWSGGEIILDPATFDFELLNGIMTLAELAELIKNM